MLTVIKKPTLLVNKPLITMSVTSTAAKATTAMVAQELASAVFSWYHAPWPL